ncbi:MAG: hypothetical protein HP498_04850 [Nitrospira sp.]|nr:hypothetical protein [Nitrospira sp.]
MSETGETGGTGGKSGIGEMSEKGGTSETSGKSRMRRALEFPFLLVALFTPFPRVAPRGKPYA